MRSAPNRHRPLAVFWLALLACPAASADTVAARSLAVPLAEPAAVPLASARSPAVSFAGASYAAPPSPGDTLVAARDTVLCDSERGARFTARTGFFAADCRQAVAGGRWRVIACRHLDLADGGLWLVEALAPGGSGVTVWIPLPWHDWA